ncbi:MAG: ankyrin repeat domain-containing protein [Rickettsiaceae bacterium]|nr:MAG: ankyrin repeat domain-containing protein [Rickettsiaceae bacterium]
MGNTALHLAAITGQLSIVELLIDQGANISAKNNNDQTALDLADSNEDEDKAEIVEEVISYLQKKLAESV